ncbi:hypothetical protein [Sciscionella marina]|uniref:hypothetical protein n=1 Tax=Sciscionella marina TaxID=508770 RepID=UPI00146E30F8|nr:hypothetical protein [Sciscionella marina]
MLIDEGEPPPWSRRPAGRVLEPVAVDRAGSQAHGELHWGHDRGELGAAVARDNGRTEAAGAAPIRPVKVRNAFAPSDISLPNPSACLERHVDNYRSLSSGAAMCGDRRRRISIQ